MKRIIILAACLFPWVTAAAAPKPKAEPPPPPRDLAIDMGAPFHDHAILQRGMKAPVWGWGKPGTRVTVSFAGQTKTATADEDGKWMLELDPLPASAEPAEMVIREQGGKTETLKDILVGEVWMASGQSNMQWLASSCIVGRKLIPEILARVEAGKEKMPVIREGKVTNVFSSLYPTEHAKGQWSNDWNGFSAIAFAFAYEIAKEVQVPVGIVNCAFSTTQIQAWIPREGFAAGQDEYTKAIYRKILESDHRSPEHAAAWKRFEQDLETWAAGAAERTTKGLAVPPRPPVPGNMNGNRDATWMCNGKIMPMAPYAIRGAIWNQGYANIDEGLVYRNNLHSLVRGWRTVFRNPEMPVYFHQFYCPGKPDDGLTLNSAAEMRLGTWLAHREIPNAAMASQIDVSGGVHYYSKAVPGQRLARHALKNQYGKDLIANGPMFKNYEVKGDKLILELDHADGLCVGKSMTVPGSYVDPVVIENGEDQVTLFHLADKDLKWRRAKAKIVGNRIELTAPGLAEPRGVAYGCNGVNMLPGIYNRAMLPLTPFIFYDHKLVVSNQWDLEPIRLDGGFPLMTWPMEYLPLADELVDPKTYGLQYQHRKLALLAPPFHDNAVIQAGVPTRFYGKALPDSVVTLRFAGTEQSVTLGPDDGEWELTVPALDAGAEPKSLHVACTLDGKLVHERKLSNIVVGDVWYVAAHEHKVERGEGVPKEGPAPLEAWAGGNPQLRMFMSYGKRAENMPERFKMNASGSPDSRFFPRWSPTIGLTRELAERIHAKTGKPVGIIILDPGTPLPVKAWVGFGHLDKIPAWKPDLDELRPLHAPDPKVYLTNTRAYIQDWRDYWNKVRGDRSFGTGGMPVFPGNQTVETLATKTYNQSICAFSPGNFKAILCLTGKGFVADDAGAGFGPQFSVMANCWKETFARGRQVIDPAFIYIMPDKAIAPKATRPAGIMGTSHPVVVNEWPAWNTNVRTGTSTMNDATRMAIEQAVMAVYP